MNDDSENHTINMIEKDTSLDAKSMQDLIEERVTAIAIGSEKENPLHQKITAIGKGKLAEQILELAFSHGIRVRQDKDLTRLLSALEQDSPIPTEALLAVAEILSYVYRANRQPNPFEAILADKENETLLEKLNEITTEER